MADMNWPKDVDIARRQIVQAGERLVNGRVLSRSQHGNMSVRLAERNRIVITGKSSLDQIDPADLAVLDLDGNVVNGYLDPVSHEIVQMHAAVYRARDDIGAVVHTHSPNVTAFALASKPIEPAYEALVRFGLTDPVPVAKYGPRGSEQSVTNIIDVLGPRTKAVLLENHGLLAMDTDLESVLRTIFVLEESAELILKADALGGAKRIPPEMIHDIEKRRDEFAATGGARRKPA